MAPLAVVLVSRFVAMLELPFENMTLAVGGMLVVLELTLVFEFTFELALGLFPEVLVVVEIVFVAGIFGNFCCIIELSSSSETSSYMKRSLYRNSELI
jgi:hypothetical protein